MYTKSPFFPATMVINHLRDYPTPSNLNIFFSWGSLAGVCLVIQILTGIFLVMHYSPTTMELSFQSVSHILREVNQGWLIRYIHANGASIFFIVLYLHIAKGLYYKSYVYEFRFTWTVGCIIFLLTMAAAFLGYCLVAGQMSFWGATVITNLISAVPVIGVHLVYWIWGGFSVNNATVTRFFSLHYLIPFIILLLVMIHLYFLHEVGSTNPSAEGKLDTHHLYTDQIFFYPYFFLKDLYGLVGLFILFTVLVCFAPNLLGHSDNYIEANPLVTPAHIVPEWYFLPFYAILRSIPNKIGGVLMMFLSIFVFFLLPPLQKIAGQSLWQIEQRFTMARNQGQQPSLLRGKPLIVFIENLRQIWVITLFMVFCLLGWIGGMPVEEPMVTVGAICTTLFMILAGLLAILP